MSKRNIKAMKTETFDSKEQANTLWSELNTVPDEQEDVILTIIETHLINAFSEGVKKCNPFIKGK